MSDSQITDFATVQERALALQLRGEGPEFDSEGRRIYWALAYRYGETDTYGTTMAPGAMSHVTVDDFRILQYHRRDEDPVGKPVALEHTDDGLWVGFVFADTERAVELQRLVDGGFLRGVSVGFTPAEPISETVKVRADGVVVFQRVDLHELSLVNTPSSRKALVDLARSVGEDPENLAELLGFEDAPAPEVEVAAGTDTDTEELASQDTDEVATDSDAPEQTGSDELRDAIDALRRLGVAEDILARVALPVAPEAQDDATDASEAVSERADEKPAVEAARPSTVDTVRLLRTLSTLRR